MLLESCLDVHKNSATLSRLCTVRMWPFPRQRATALMWAERSQGPFNIRLIRHFQTCGSSRLDHCGPSSGNRPFFVSTSHFCSVTSSAQSFPAAPFGLSPRLEQGLCLSIFLFLTRQSFFKFSQIKKLFF